MAYYFKYPTDKELGQEGLYHPNLNDDLMLTLPEKKYKSDSANTYSDIKLVKWDPERTFEGMPWGNIQLNTPFKYKNTTSKVNENFLATNINCPIPVDNTSYYGFNNFTDNTDHSVTYYWKYTANDSAGYTQMFYNGSSSASKTFSGSSLILKIQAQGGGGAGGQYNHYTKFMIVGIGSVLNEVYAYCGGGGGGGGAFGLFYIDMSQLKELYITHEHKGTTRGVEGSPGVKGGSFVLYKGSSTSGTKLYTVHGGGGGNLVYNGIADFTEDMLIGSVHGGPSTPTGGKGGTIETHVDEVAGIKLVQYINGADGGQGGGAGGDSNDNTIVQDATAGGNISKAEMYAPMLKTAPTLGDTSGGISQMKYIDDWYEGWGGGGGASASGSGGKGEYLPSDRQDVADDGKPGELGAGGGGGGLIQDWWGSYNRSKGGNGGGDFIYYYWGCPRSTS